MCVLDFPRNDDDPFADHHWAAVQVASMTIGEQQVDLGGYLHAHVSLGRWCSNSPEWSKRCARARCFLMGVTDLAFEAMINAQCSDQPLCIFRFMVHSTGGQKLHSLSQILSSHDMLVMEERGISPPGRVEFIISVCMTEHLWDFSTFLYRWCACTAGMSLSRVSFQKERIVH